MPLLPVNGDCERAYNIPYNSPFIFLLFKNVIPSSEVSAGNLLYVSFKTFHHLPPIYENKRVIFKHIYPNNFTNYQKLPFTYYPFLPLLLTIQNYPLFLPILVKIFCSYPKLPITNYQKLPKNFTHFHCLH